VQDALQHFVLLLFAAGLSTVGWFMAHKPSETYRIFTLWTQPEENKYLVDFCKGLGWLFAVFFGVGTLMYLGLMVHDLLR